MEFTFGLLYFLLRGYGGMSHIIWNSVMLANHTNLLNTTHHVLIEKFNISTVCFSLPFSTSKVYWLSSYYSSAPVPTLDHCFQAFLIGIKSGKFSLRHIFDLLVFFNYYFWWPIQQIISNLFRLPVFIAFKAHVGRLNLLLQSLSSQLGGVVRSFSNWI